MDRTWVSLNCRHIILHCLPLFLGLKRDWQWRQLPKLCLLMWSLSYLMGGGCSGHPIHIGTWFGNPKLGSNLLIPGSPCIERTAFLGEFITWFLNFSFLLFPLDPEETHTSLSHWTETSQAVLLNGFSARPSPFSSALLARLGSESASFSQWPEQTYHQENGTPVSPFSEDTRFLYGVFLVSFHIWYLFPPPIPYPIPFVTHYSFYINFELFRSEGWGIT